MARGEVGLLQAEIVAEFVDVGEAYFVVEGRMVALAVVPQLFEKERDARRFKVVRIVALAQRRTAEESERIGRDAVLEPVGGNLPFAEDGIRDTSVTGVQTCALPI